MSATPARKRVVPGNVRRVPMFYRKIGPRQPIDTLGLQSLSNLWNMRVACETVLAVLTIGLAVVPDNIFGKTNS